MKINHPILTRLAKIDRRLLLLILTLLAGFSFLVFALILTYHISTETHSVSPLIQPLISYHAEFMVVIISLGVAVGAAVYYLALMVMDTRERDAKSNAQALLRFLPDDERQVVSHLVSRGGSAFQSDISRLDGMSRLRAHRVVERLERRGILSVESVGRVNHLSMAPDLRAALVGEGENQASKPPARPPHPD